jgi:hypothetical protein
VVDDEKDENIDVNPFALKPRHAQQLSKPVVPTVVQSRQAKQKQDEEENDDSANDNPFAVKRKRKPLLSAFASRDDFTADDKETASPAKRHKTTLTAKHSPLASLNRPSPFLTPPAPTQVNMQQQQEQLKQLSTAAHEPGPRTVYKCPEDKPEISSKTIVITADNLIVNQPTRGIRNTKRFVKVR